MTSQNIDLSSWDTLYIQFTGYNYLIVSHLTFHEPCSQDNAIK
jgi:hypothetical protein